MTAVPVPPTPDDSTLRLAARFDNGVLNATTIDRAIRVAGKEVRLVDVREITSRPALRVALTDGKTLDGEVTGLEAVPVRLGDQSVAVDLRKAANVRFGPALAAEPVLCTLVVRRGEEELLRHSNIIPIAGVLPKLDAGSSQVGIGPPALEGDRTVRKVVSPIADVAVGGAGRYLVLHLPKVRTLAVFDVSTAEVVGYIPANEDEVKFAAGLEDVMLVLPKSGTLERWSLKTLEREASVKIPIPAYVLDIAMGSASKGPLLVRTGSNPGRGPTDFALVDTVTMKADHSRIFQINLQLRNRADPVHLRASADGRVFGMWYRTTTPPRVLTIELAGPEGRISYVQMDAGYAIPSQDGTDFFTQHGYGGRQIMDGRFRTANAPVLPARHGDWYLTLPPSEKDGDVTVHAPGQNGPIATLKDLHLVLSQDTIMEKFSFDKRIHLIPDAHVVITIPASNDQLVLHRLRK